MRSIALGSKGINFIDNAGMRAILDRKSWDMTSGVACRLRNGLDEEGEEKSSVLQC
jgi:hypothetical protein